MPHTNWALLQRLAALALLFILTACGGGAGGGGSVGEGDSPTSPVAPVTNTIILADGSISQTVLDSISHVSTSQGAGRILGSLPIVSNGGELVLALNTQNQIVLANAVTEPAATTVLSARSTALALARMAWGLQSFGATTNAAFEQASSLAQLQTAVEDALSRGEAPSAHPAVADLVMQVLEEVSVALQRQTSKAQLEKGFYGTDERGILVNSAPSTLAGGGFLLGTVSLDGPFSGRNNTLLHWDATVGSVTTRFEPGKHFVLDGAPVGSPYTLSLAQSSEARFANAAELVRQGAALALALVPGDLQACSTAVAKILVRSPKLTEAVLSPTGVTLMAYLKDVTSLLPVLDPNFLTLCLSPGLLAQDLAKRIAAELTFVGAIKKAYKVFSFSQLAQQMQKNWEFAEKFSVCVDRNSFVATCVKTVKLSEPVAMIPGAKYLPEYQGIDQGGMLTVFPASITFESATSDTLSVTIAGTLEAKFPGYGEIRAKEAVTALDSPMGVRIVVPNVDTPSIVEVGRSFAALLKDPQGQNLITEDAVVTWQISDTAKVASPNVGGSTGILLKALAAGKVTLTATFASGHSAQATVDVVEPVQGDATAKGTYAISGRTNSAQPCLVGTHSWQGTLTVNYSQRGSQATLVGGHSFSWPCVSRSYDSDNVVIPLTVDGAGRLTGSYHKAYDADANQYFPALTHVDLSLSSATGPDGKLVFTGTLAITFEAPDVQGLAQGSVSASE